MTPTKAIISGARSTSEDTLLAAIRRKFRALHGEPDHLTFSRHIEDKNGHLVGYVTTGGRHIFYGRDWCEAHGVKP